MAPTWVACAWKGLPCQELAGIFSYHQLPHTGATGVEVSSPSTLYKAREDHLHSFPILRLANGGCNSNEACPRRCLSVRFHVLSAYMGSGDRGGGNKVGRFWLQLAHRGQKRNVLSGDRGSRVLWKR